jgi:DNA-binding PadR family transcriptional regulator
VTRARLPDLSLTEWAVLALTAEHPTHGFAIAKELAPDGDLGRIWTIPRPIVYRALARLEQDELVKELGVEPGDGGPQRTRFGATPGGRVAVEEWLRTPSRHVRDLRTRLLLQLRFLDRRGRDLTPLAAAQLEQLQPILTALAEQVGATTGFVGLVARWRYESAQAAARVLEGLVAEASTPGPASSR